VWFNEHQYSPLSNKYKNFPSVCKVTLRQYIMFCWHFLTADLSETLGTRRHTSEERKLHTHRCENIKIFKIRLTLQCALDHSGSNFNESHLHSAADGVKAGRLTACTDWGTADCPPFWKMLKLWFQLGHDGPTNFILQFHSSLINRPLDTAVSELLAVSTVL